MVIEAMAGAGGSSLKYKRTGGLGVYGRGVFTLTKDSVLKILVGQKGGVINPDSSNGGGGGGTFIVNSDDSPLLIVGGGGGPSSKGTGYSGLIVEAGGNSDSNAKWGVDGKGGNAYSTGGAGGGLLTDGKWGGSAFVNGGVGKIHGSYGGFGGGGHGHDRGGGAGGYSGGAGGNGGGGPGAGGGSKNTDPNGLLIAGFSYSHGQVVITKLSAADNGFRSLRGTVMSRILGVTSFGRQVFLDKHGYRFATGPELLSAREAGTAGSISILDAPSQIVPRGLPGKINEWGFDTFQYAADYWWPVKD